MNICEWYLLCTNKTNGFLWHPVLAWVPTCNRCANKHGRTVITEEAIMSSLSHITEWPEKFGPEVWGNAVDLLGGIDDQMLPETAEEVLKLAV